MTLKFTLTMVMTLAMTSLLRSSSAKVSSNKNGKVVKIACLLPRDNRFLFSIDRIYPAIQIAIDKVTKQGGLLAGHRIHVDYADSACASAVAMNAAINFFINNKPHVFFGPCCDYAANPVARQLTYWNIPNLIPSIAQDFGSLKLKQFSMTTRIAASYDKLYDFFNMVMQKFGWTRFLMFYEPAGQNYQYNELCHLFTDGMHVLYQRDYNISMPYFRFDNITVALDEMVQEFGTRNARLSLKISCAYN